MVDLTRGRVSDDGRSFAKGRAMFLMASRSRKLVSLSSGFALIRENASVPGLESTLCIRGGEGTFVQAPEDCI